MHDRRRGAEGILKKLLKTLRVSPLGDAAAYAEFGTEPDLELNQLVSYEDVTARVLAALPKGVPQAQVNEARKALLPVGAGGQLPAHVRRMELAVDREDPLLVGDEDRALRRNVACHAGEPVTAGALPSGLEESSAGVWQNTQVAPASTWGVGPMWARLCPVSRMSARARSVMRPRPVE